MSRIPVCITEPKYRMAHNTQLFKAHLKAHTRLLAFSLTGETPTHERIVVQNICMRSTSRLGEICS